MLWSFHMQVLTLVLDLVTARRRDDRAKDLEIALLHQQLLLLQRQQTRPGRLSRWDRVVLALLAHRLSSLALSWLQIHPAAMPRVDNHDAGRPVSARPASLLSGARSLALSQ